MLHREGECSDNEGDVDFNGDEDLSCDAEGKLQMKKVLRLLTPVSKRWNSMYYLRKRALVLKNLLIKLSKSMQLAFLGETPPPPRALPMILLMLLFGIHLAIGSPLALSINDCCVCVEIPVFQLAHWQCYQELQECMEPLKTLSLLLESSIEATIHTTLDYLLALLYHIFEDSPQKGDPIYKVFNEFVGNFWSKLLTLLDDVEQFFLWVVTSTLDGRKIGFDWLKPVWDHDGEWPNMTYK